MKTAWTICAIWNAVFIVMELYTIYTFPNTGYAAFDMVMLPLNLFAMIWSLRRIHELSIRVET